MPERDEYTRWLVLTSGRLVDVKQLFVALSAFMASAFLALASWFHVWPMAVVTVVISAVVAVGWPQLMGVTARRSLSAVILVAGVVAVLGASIVSRVESLFFWSSVALAFGVMAVFVIQVLRGAERPHRLESTLGACAGVVITTMSAGWVAGLRYPEGMAGASDGTGLGLLRVRELPVLDDAFLSITGSGGELTVVALAALTLMAGTLVAVLPLRDAVVLPLVVLVSVGSSLGLSLAWGELTVLFAGLVGLAAGAVLAAFRRFLMIQGAPDRLLSQLAVGAAPVAAMGGFVYFTERILLVVNG